MGKPSVTTEQRIEITRGPRFWRDMERRCAEIRERDEQKACAYVRASQYSDSRSLNARMARVLGGVTMGWRDRLRLKRLWQPFAKDWIERFSRKEEQGVDK